VSSVLRAESIAVLDRPGASSGQAAPRIFGTRVLRGQHVGLQQPVAVAAPVAAPAPSPLSFDEVSFEEAPAMSVEAPSFDELAEAARAQGYSLGYEEGRAAGLAAVEEAFGQAALRLMNLVNMVHENHATFYRAAEHQVVDLALQIAAKVVEREVENVPDLAVNVIRAALEEMDARTAVRVRVSPDDEELLRRRWSMVVPSGIAPERIELQSDDRVQPGGAIIETTQGQVDAQLDSKMAQLGNALLTFVMDVDTMHVQAGDGDA
jgi:flagellar assembly protein FliH